MDINRERILKLTYFIAFLLCHFCKINTNIKQPSNVTLTGHALNTNRACRKWEMSRHYIHIYINYW